MDAIAKVKSTAATGEDEIPICLLKECCLSVAYPIYLLWKQSFDTGQIHHSFLSQLITPIHKGGSKFPPVNYRPVSLTSHLIKIFERVIQKKLVEYLEEHNLISSSQHGFRRGRSCLSELLDHYNELIDNFGASQDSDVIYLDFSKAFDKVDHNLLIKKLQRYGIAGKLLRWIESFISNRQQKVVVDGVQSYICQVLSGIPQGSVLGPLLFLLFVNDMGQSLEHSTLRMFDLVWFYRVDFSSRDLKMVRKDKSR